MGTKPRQVIFHTSPLWSRYLKMIGSLRARLVGESIAVCLEISS
jgi:hypothetical protein